MAALLFDLDGTMLDTDPIHLAVFTEMMADFGLNVDHDFYMQHVHGRLNEDFFAEFLPDLEDPHALSRKKEAAFRDRLPRPYPEMPGITALLARAEREGWPMAVVTNAERANAEAMLDAIGHRDRIDVLVIGEECSKAKPDPEPYHAAMRALGKAPENCIAFEDSPSGLRAAAASGAYTVGVASSLTPAQLGQAGAATTIEHFNDPALEPVLQRLKGDSHDAHRH
ncbi:MAG: HAD family phosphatase [Pseudomonadota bacterium]